MVDDMSWDHSAEDFQNELLLHSQRSSSLGRSYEDTNITIPRRELYMLLLDLRRSQDALIHHIRLSSIREGEHDSRPELRNSWLQKCRIWTHWVSNYVFLITLSLQIIDIIILTIVDFTPSRNRSMTLIVGQVIMVILMTLNLAVTLFASVNLAKRLYRRHPTILLLGQTYLSTVLLFAGIYIAIYRLDKDAWHNVKERIKPEHEMLVVELYCHFLFLSVSTGTLSGVAHILPYIWYTYLLVSLQLMLSYIYFGAVLSQAIVFNRREKKNVRNPSLANGRA